MTEDKPANRASRIGVVAAVLVGLLGFAMATQLRRDDSREFSAAREGDLVQILDELDNRHERLRAEVTDLDERLADIQSDQRGSEAALTDAQRRAAELAILAGTVPAYGPGVEVTFGVGQAAPTADRLLDAIQELRGAGAEAMQISGANGAQVRIVVSTFFAPGNNDAINVSGTELTFPITVTALGDSATIKTALFIPGGVVDTVRQAGGHIDVADSPEVRISATAPKPAPRYAKPAD